MLQRKTSHLLLILFLVFSCFLVSAKPVHAADITTAISDWFKGTFTTDSTTKTAKAAVSESADKEKFDQESLSNIFTGIVIHSVGVAGVRELDSMSYADRKTLENGIGYGVVGDINKGIVALYNPPASTRTYVADVMKSAKIIPEAQAQGLGFAALDPILETWKQFRNLAYLFFVVIFLIIGFMIMFRTKVGQAAITAQQAIPSVIVAMLAVTFSYAIAGFLIDLMYVVMYMLAGFFSEGSEVVNKNIFTLVGVMFKGTTASATQSAIEQFMADALNIGFVGEALAWMSSLLGTVIIGLAILFSTFKIFFELVKSYVSVIIQIIFSPIILMMGAFPGKNVFFKWIKDLVGNLILWPVVLLCVLVQRMLTAPIRALQGSGTELNDAFGGGFMPPFLLGQGQGAVLPVILGIGILLVIPEIMQQVKKAMGVDEGIFGQLAKSAAQNLRVSEPIVPYATGAMGGAAGGLRAGGQMLLDENSILRREGLFKDGKINRNVVRSVGEQMKAGYEVVDKKTGQKKMVGGWDKGFESGKGFGDWARIQADRIRSGQILDPETTEKTLARIAGLDKKGGENNDKKEQVEEVPK